MNRSCSGYQSIILGICFICLISAGCNNRQRLPIGTRAAADSLLQPRSQDFESGQYAKALRYVDSAFHSITDHTLYEYIGYYGTQAYVNGVFNNPSTQIRYLDSAIGLLREYQDNSGLTDELSGFLMSRGDVLFNLKQYSESYEDFFEATRLADQFPDVCRKMHVPYSIGMILYRQKQFERSGRYFLESLQYIDACEENIAYRNNKKQEVLDNIGLCYTRQKKYDSAMQYYRLAFDLVKNNPFKLAVDTVNSLTRQAAALGVISGNMAKVFLGKEQPDSAIVYYQRAIAFNAERGHEFHDMQLCMVQLSEIYLLQNKTPELHQTLERLRGSMDSIHSADIVTDYEHLQYAYYKKVNEPAKALIHLETWLRKNDSTAEQQKQMLQTDIGKELKDKQQQFDISLLQKNNELNKIYLLVMVGVAVLVMIILGLIYAMYAASRKNVQHLTQLNTEISGRRQALEQALQKLENTNLEKDRILRVVAHDLRNPIGGIVSLSNILLSDNMVGDKNRPMIEAISKASVSSLELINELLSADRIAHDAEKKITDIGALLKQVVNMAQLKATEKNQHIELELPQGEVELMIHPGQLERVINNLLVNAVKFSGEQTVIHVSLKTDNDRIQISVQDAGIGIPSHHLAHLFEGSPTFKRTGTAGEKSFGLGLSICRQIVEAMGGEMRVESEEGKGSVFYVSLPGEGQLLINN